MHTTIGIPYESVNSFEIMSYLKQYTSCVMVVYNDIKDYNLPYVQKKNNTYDSDTFQKLLSLEHLDLITKHYHFRQCVISDACAILSSEEARKKNDLLMIKSYEDDIKELEEFGSKIEKSWSLKKIYDSFKKSKTMYRLSLDSFNPKFYRFGSTKSKISHCEVTREMRLNNRNIVE